MTRERPNVPTVPASGRTRSGGSRDGSGQRRSRTRGGDPTPDLTDEELRALADTNVDPDDVIRIESDAKDDTQEASDHDRDTPRDRIEGLVLEQDDEF